MPSVTIRNTLANDGAGAVAIRPNQIGRTEPDEDGGVQPVYGALIVPARISVGE